MYEHLVDIALISFVDIALINLADIALISLADIALISLADIALIGHYLQPEKMLKYLAKTSDENGEFHYIITRLT